jgi:hypothetical protein
MGLLVRNLGRPHLPPCKPDGISEDRGICVERDRELLLPLFRVAELVWDFHGVYDQVDQPGAGGNGLMGCSALCIRHHARLSWCPLPKVRRQHCIDDQLN